MNSDRYEPLDEVSALVAGSTSEQSRNLLWTATEVRGTWDIQALKTAIEQTGLMFPSLMRRLNFARTGLRKIIVRDRRSDDHIPLFESPLDRIDGDSDLFGAIQKHVVPTMDRDRDLFLEPPAEVHFLSVSEDDHALVLVAHHVVGDMYFMAQATREIFRQYGLITTGVEFTGSESPRIFSSAGKKKVTPDPSKEPGMLAEYKTDRKYRKAKPAWPRGSGTKDDPGENAAKAVVSQQRTAAMTDALSSDGLRLIDHLLACSAMALDQWNQERGVSPSAITSAVTVNMRGRFGMKDTHNQSGVIIFRTGPQHRETYSGHVRYISDKISGRLEEQDDISYRKLLRKGQKIANYLPVWLRQMIARQILANGAYSIHVAHMGEIIDRPEEISSEPVEVGDLRIMEMHGGGYKLAGRPHMTLASFIYRKRLNLNLWTSSAMLTPDENQALLDMIVDHLCRTDF